MIQIQSIIFFISLFASAPAYAGDGGTLSAIICLIEFVIVVTLAGVVIVVTGLFLTETFSAALSHSADLFSRLVNNVIAGVAGGLITAGIFYLIGIDGAGLMFSFSTGGIAGVILSGGRG